MKQFILLIVLSISFTGISQQIINKTYNSVELNSKRNLKIYIPKNYDTDIELNYPVAIVLGDDYLFDLYVGNAKLYADADKAPRQIVVGIDMSKTYDRDVSIIPSNDDLTSTAKQFQRFIRKEIIPFIEATYRASPFLTIAGEGKSINIITSFLKQEKPIFNSYICASPYFSDLSGRTIESYTLSRLGTVDNTFFIFTSGNKEYVKKEQYDKLENKVLGNDNKHKNNYKIDFHYSEYLLIFLT